MTNAGGLVCKMGVLGLTGFVAFSALSAEGLSLRVGPVYRTGMKTDVSGGSYAQAAGLTLGAGYKRLPEGVGPLREYADRTYADGYVNQDGGTGNPASIDPNTTWFWGYQNASQYSPMDGTLTFSAPGGREMRREVLRDGGWSEEDDLDGWGMEVAAELPLTALTEAEVALQVGLRGFWNMEQTHRGSTYREQGTDRRFTVLDVYDVAGTLIPPAPHAGTYDGPFDDPPVIPSPVIPNLPEARREATGRVVLPQAYNRVQVDMDADLYELRAGPVFSRAVGDGRVRVSLSPALTLNILQMDAVRREAWVEVREDGVPQTRARWTDRDCDTEFLFGAGLQAAAEVALDTQWAVALHASADWVDEARTRVGPTRLKTDVSGFTVGLAVVRAFGGPDEARD